jgi:hypothetical protein
LTTSLLHGEGTCSHPTSQPRGCSVINAITTDRRLAALRSANDGRGSARGVDRRARDRSKPVARMQEHAQARGRPARAGELTLEALALSVVCHVRSSEDCGRGRGRRLGRSTTTEVRQGRFSAKRVNLGGLSPCLGQAATRSGAPRVLRAGARSGRRTSCSARPGSRAESWWPSRSRPWGGPEPCQRPSPSPGTGAGPPGAR